MSAEFYGNIFPGRSPEDPEDHWQMVQYAFAVRFVYVYLLLFHFICLVGFSCLFIIHLFVYSFILYIF